jgi:DNA-directed RNA polymerase specialized sigma24 family protein
MELPEIQKRRFMLHFDLGLTYEQIGTMEGCTKMPIKRSIDRAIEKIRLALKNF